MELESSVDEILDAAVDLIDVASLETELLRAMRPQDIVPLMERKSAVAQYYYNLLKKLERRRAHFIDLPERRRDEVRETSDWVKLILAENARLLRAAADANERLLLAIKDAAQAHYGPGIGRYDRAGKLENSERGSRGVTVTLGVEERV